MVTAWTRRKAKSATQWLLALLMGLGSVSPALGGPANLSVLDYDDRTEQWSLGLALMSSTSPLLGVESREDLMPLISYGGKTWYLSGAEAGYHLIDTERWQLDALVQYRFGKYDSSDSPQLAGMATRRATVEAGGRLIYKTARFGDVGLELSGDTLGRHRGHEANLFWSKGWQRGNWWYRPWLAYNWQSQQLTQYYFGVNPGEVREERPRYNPGKAASFLYGVDVDYRFTPRSHLSLNFSKMELDHRLYDSPIVDQKELYGVMLGFRHELGEAPSQVSGEPSPKRDRKQSWSLRLAHGCATDKAMVRIIALEIDCDAADSSLSSVFVGRKLSDTVLGLPVEGWLKMGYAHHDEEGLQENVDEYVLALKGYFSHFPWREVVRTRLGLAEGLSYVDRIPYVERVNLERINKNTSRLLNYLDYSLDINLGDVFRTRSMEHCYFGFSIHHRSGIFATAELFRNVNGGSNYNTLYLECEFST